MEFDLPDFVTELVIGEISLLPTQILTLPLETKLSIIISHVKYMIHAHSVGDLFCNSTV